MSGIESQILVHVQMYVIKILTLHTGPLGTELSERIFKYHQIQKDSNFKKNCHLKAMKQMANNYIHLKVAQSS